ncbi:MAG TPA: hypothetical protein VNV43_04365 [Candidatus Acidoferrales bacterium]|jgi:hypothetical protein|nr:hypothetical protein [Candidatus Acidoferrales bacterium]
MKKILLRVVLAVFVLIVLALVVVFFSLNSIVKKGVETLGPDMTKVEVRLGSADISPFSGGGKLSKLFVGNPEGFKTTSAIQMGDIKVGVKVSSVLKDVIVINEINIQAPEITLEGNLSGNNLSKILDNVSGTDEKQKATPAAAGAKKEKKYCVKELMIDGGKINLSLDLSILGGKSATIPLPAIHLSNIGTETDGVTAAELVKQILKPLLESVLDAAKKEIASGGKGLENLGKGGVNDAKKAAGGVLDMFQKK